jgi:GT2 family glycosyltransferase
MKKRFSAFIMTYERPEMVLSTIGALLAQTLPPDKILIVDNSESDKTKEAILKLNHPLVEYFRVGFNSGPAGGAYYGLSMLAGQGYDWIFWGDDDDPPKINTCFETLLSEVSTLTNPGILAAVGHQFDVRSGVIKRTTDHRISTEKWLPVDIVAGGMCLIANGEMIRQNVLPNPDLFFGFEDLDFCIKARKKGYKIYAHAALFKYYRENSKRPLSVAGKRGVKKKVTSLWREYYSARNLLYLFHSNRLNLAFLNHFFKLLVKMVYNFRFGFSYGKESATLACRAIWDFHQNKLGKR